MSYFTNQCTVTEESIPRPTDVLSIEHEVLEQGSKHFIIHHPGTDFFMEIIHSFQGFFDTLPLDKQSILCGCIVDSLRFNMNVPMRFLSLSRRKQWIQVSSSEAIDAVFLALKCGWSQPNRIVLEGIAIAFRSIRASRPNRDLSFVLHQFQPNDMTIDCNHNQQSNRALEYMQAEMPITNKPILALDDGLQQQNKIPFPEELSENDEFIQILEKDFLNSVPRQGEELVTLSSICNDMLSPSNSCADS